ncbi:ribonuclease H-like domain-containing protein [Tanacetum coccineum]
MTPQPTNKIPTHPLSSTHEPATPNSTPNTHITLPTATAHGNALTTNTHHMVTRVKAGISKPLARMNCHATTTLHIPRSHLHALRDPNWHKAMVDEYNALISNENIILNAVHVTNLSLSCMILGSTFTALKRILRYVPWDNDHRTSINNSGYLCGSLCDNLCLGLPNRHDLHCARSSAEARISRCCECVARDCVIGICCLKPSHSTHLLLLLSYCDKVSAVYLSTYPVRITYKHIEIDIICSRIYSLLPVRLRVLHFPPDFQYAIFFTRFSPHLISEFCLSHPETSEYPAHTEGEY